MLKIQALGLKMENYYIKSKNAWKYLLIMTSRTTQSNFREQMKILLEVILSRHSNLGKIMKYLLMDYL